MEDNSFIFLSVLSSFSPEINRPGSVSLGGLGKTFQVIAYHLIVNIFDFIKMLNYSPNIES